MVGQGGCDGSRGRKLLIVSPGARHRSRRFGRSERQRPFEQKGEKHNEEEDEENGPKASDGQCNGFVKLGDHHALHLAFSRNRIAFHNLRVKGLSLHYVDSMRVVVSKFRHAAAPSDDAPSEGMDGYIWGAMPVSRQ